MFGQNKKFGQKCWEEEATVCTGKKQVHLVTLHWQKRFRHCCHKARETQLFIQLLVPLTRAEPIASKKIKDKDLKICLWALQAAFPFISEGIGCLFPSVQTVVAENSAWIFISHQVRKYYQLKNLNSIFNIFTSTFTLALVLEQFHRHSSLSAQKLPLFSSAAVDSMCHFLIQNR